MLWANIAFAGLKPIVLDPAYQHDKFVTQPQDIVKQFRAYTVSFDFLDDNDSDSEGDALRVPEWVAYEIKRYSGDCIPTETDLQHGFTIRTSSRKA